MVGAPSEVSQLSPDGRWRWDGEKWLPAKPQRPSHRRFWIWTGAGCLTVILLSAAGTGYWIYTLWQGVKSGATTCVPSNFPRYPGSRFGSWSYDLNGPYGSCHALFESTDDVATIVLYYQGKLNTGSWQLTLSDQNTNTITFESANGSAPFGTLQVASKDTGSEITLDLDSEECHLQGFPSYPHAQFGGQSTGPNGYGCHVVLLTKDRASAVIAYYKNELNRGDWHVDSSSASEIHFRLIYGKRTAASGTVTVGTSADERTQITIDT